MVCVSSGGCVCVDTKMTKLDAGPVAIATPRRSVPDAGHQTQDAKADRPIRRENPAAHRIGAPYHLGGLSIVREMSVSLSKYSSKYQPRCRRILHVRPAPAGHAGCAGFPASGSLSAPGPCPPALAGSLLDLRIYRSVSPWSAPAPPVSTRRTVSWARSQALASTCTRASRFHLD